MLPVSQDIHIEPTPVDSPCEGEKEEKDEVQFMEKDSFTRPITAIEGSDTTIAMSEAPPTNDPNDLSDLMANPEPYTPPLIENTTEQQEFMSDIVEKETTVDNVSNPSLEEGVDVREGGSVTLRKEDYSESCGKDFTPMQDDQERRYTTCSADVY